MHIVSVSLSQCSCSCPYDHLFMCSCSAVRFGDRPFFTAWLFSGLRGPIQHFLQSFRDPCANNSSQKSSKPPTCADLLDVKRNYNLTDRSILQDVLLNLEVRFTSMANIIFFINKIRLNLVMSFYGIISDGIYLLNGNLIYTTNSAILVMQDQVWSRS